MKPILFNGAMVKAILDGNKTATRRPIKLPRCGYFDHEPPRGIKPPYAKGDILYVRETWAIGSQMCGGICYKADNKDFRAEGEKWKPSIHMPKEAARIFLKVTDVRIERLQNITAEQCIEEGIEVDFPEPKPTYHSLAYCEMRLKPAFIKAFRELWDSTIKRQALDRSGWNANPWVWVIEFEREEART